VAENDRIGPGLAVSSVAAPSLRDRGTTIWARSRDLSRSTACYRGRVARIVARL